MSLDGPSGRTGLERFLRDRTGAQHLRIHGLQRLSGGAIQENWALDVAIDDGDWRGNHQWVVRSDAPSAVAVSLDRAQEFQVLQAAFEAGVRAPEPLWLCRDRDLIGAEFFIMRRAEGVGTGHRLTGESDLVPDRKGLVRELGENLARLHTIRPPRPELDFLPDPGRRSPALAVIADYRRHLDALPQPQPVLEWGLRWCELNAPEQESVCLIHRDYRTGNYLVHDGRLTAILDWEFAAWGNPDEDVGWFLARCWRFKAPEREAGGIGDANDFLDAYRAAANRNVSAAAVRYWQVMAHVRWAIVALQQAERHLSGEEASLELALTGRIPATLYPEILALTGDEP